MTSRISFALLLPLFALTLWLAVVPTQLGWIAWRLRHTPKSGTENAQPDGSSEPSPPGLAFSIPRENLSKFLFQGELDRWSHPVMAFNLPGILVEILISFPTTWPSIWHPVSFMMNAWRTIGYPFYCLPIWWFTGKGLDSAMGRRRLHWVPLALGTILFLTFLFFFLGFRFFSPAADRFDSGWLLWGLAMWAIGFGVFPFAWVRQIRRNRTLLRQRCNPQIEPLHDTPPS